MKKYIQPNMKVVEIECQNLLQMSVSPDGHITGPQRSNYQDDWDDLEELIADIKRW